MAEHLRDQQDIAAEVEDLIRAHRYPRITGLVRSLPATMTVLGAVEMLFGLFALYAPFAAGAFAVLLLGGALVVGGVAEFVSSFVKRSWGRFAVGILSMAAGALIIAHPLFNLAFLTLVLSAYFIAAGLSRIVNYRESGWMIAGGMLSVLLGLVLLTGWPGTSLFAVGLLIAVNLLLGGAALLSVGSGLRRSIARMG